MNSVDLWVNITFEIIDCIQDGRYNQAQELLEKRQEIINNEPSLKIFKEKLIENNALELDNKIKSILARDIESTKQEIKKYKLTKNANSNYAKNISDKMNIFSQKV